MKRFNITENPNVCLYGYKLPKGAMYGKDKHGVWICIDYRVKSRKMIAHAHYVGGRLITPAKYVWGLTILRPEQPMGKVIYGKGTDVKSVGEIIRRDDGTYFFDARHRDGKIKRYNRDSYEQICKLHAKIKASVCNLDGEYNNSIRWKRSVEINGTTAKILELYDRFVDTDKCVIEYRKTSKNDAALASNCVRMRNVWKGVEANGLYAR